MASLANSNLNGSSAPNATTSTPNSILNNEALSRLSGAGDKLKKLQIVTKKDSSSSFNKEMSSSRLNNIISASNLNSLINSSNGSSSNSSSNSNIVSLSTWEANYEEIVVTIKKSERGFGFELRNGILIVAVYPNTPASNSGIRVGDIILKVNGTCVRAKDQNEITNMIHESNSFVSLTLQRKISQLTNSNKHNNSSNQQNSQQIPANSVNNLTNPNDDADSISKQYSHNNSNSEDQALKNVTNNQHYQSNLISMNDLNNADSNTSDLDYENNENTNHLLHHSNLNSNTEIAGSLNSPDIISSKLSEYINSNLPHIEKSINNHLAAQHSDSTMSITNDLQQNSSELVNNSDFTNPSFVKTHRKQMSDDSTHNTNVHVFRTNSNSSSSTAKNNTTHNNATNNPSSSSNKRSIKKTRSAASSKTLQTQSLSNIAVPLMTHSASDNDLEQNKQLSIDPDDQDLLDYKDDLSYTSDDNLHEASNDKSLFDMSGYNDYSQLITRPINLSILLIYILNTEQESPKNLYFCIFVDEFLQSNEKKETVLRWSFELYTTFLMSNAPLKLNINEQTCKKLEDLFDRTALDNLAQIKKLFEEIKYEALDVVNMQLAKFREVKQMGLANLFHGNDLLKMTQMNKNDFDSMKASIADALHLYINEMGREIGRVCVDWNGSNDPHLSALISSFVTFTKRFGLPIKQIGKIDVEKIPTFVNKKAKLKKNSSSSTRGHSFIDCSFLNPKLVCAKCNYSFWGIGYQGIICQKTKCEIKVHRSCLNQGAPIECHGSQKTIRTDYKEKFDNIQKLFFGKKKEEEPTAAMDINGSKGTIGSNTSMENSSFTNGDILTNLPSDYDQRNLPVELAIKRFESLNAKKISPSLITSPTIPIGTNLIRNNTIGSTSASNSNSNSNSSSLRMNNIHQSSSNEQMLYSNQQNNQHILPNKQTNSLNGSTSTITNTKTNSKEQACKRVGSLKVDVKKIKSNVTRSKSDPEPEEIKNAISTRLGDRYSIESIDNNNDSSLTNNSSINYSSSVSSANTTLTGTSSTTPAANHSSYRTSASPAPASTHHGAYSQFQVYTGQQPQQQLSNNASTFTLTPQNANNHRQPWMNVSDMEIDDELPSLNPSIDKTQMSKKDIKTQEVINELIHTEQKHVRNLKIMKHHFYVPIKVNMYLTEEERNILFPNLEEVLELHTDFNNKLKKLRKEHSVIPVDELTNIILEQFKGEQGEKFQHACARFCENQGQAMKLLQQKLKNSDKFNQFITNAENHVICRKLQLKDFIPTEVQRLVKYRLLFHELTKNVTDEDQKERLQECVDASSKISSYVNKAVTECENRKRAEEIQARMDTKEFDSYCLKSPLLAPYKNLDIRSRKLIYEGELEWKINVTYKLLALLFDDILVFLERSNDSEKRRCYILKPLSFVFNRSKQTFTPVIPLSCINRFSPMHDKRSFHLVVIFDEHMIKSSSKTLNQQNSTPQLLQQQLSTSSSSSQPSKTIQTQMLFILIAKSGDERNKWTQYLQDLTGKMSQNDKHAIDLSNVHTLSHQLTTSVSTGTIASANLTPGSTTTNSSTNTINSLQIAPINVNLNENNNSISKSSSEEKLLNNGPNEYSRLEAQLRENTASIKEMLTARQSILEKMLKFNRNVDMENEHDNEALNTSESILDNSIHILNLLTNNMISDQIPNTPTTPVTPSLNTFNTKMVKNLFKLESNLNKLRQNLQIETTNISNLPNLTITASVDTSSQKNESIANITTTPLLTAASSNSVVNTRLNRPLRSCQIVESTYNNPELISTSSIISTASSNGDLSEDEQINYYDDTNTNSNFNLSANNNNSTTSEFVNTFSAEPVLVNTMRSQSNSSDQTVVNNKQFGSSPPLMPPPVIELNILNDLSDDEVKEYNVFKDAMDEEDEDDDDEEEDEVINGNDSSTA